MMKIKKAMSVGVTTANTDSASEVDSGGVELGNLSYTVDSSVNDRLKDVNNHFLETVGLSVTSLGDDTFALISVAPNHSVEEITAFYAAETQWEVELKKSLVTYCNGEYLREQPHPDYYIDLKCFAPEIGNVYKRFIAICKPTSHVLKTLAFPEGMDSRSDMIKAIGTIAKLLNLNLHPNLLYIIEQLKSVMLFRLFTEQFYYVPVYNKAAWVKAGKPSQGSKYHVLVKGYADGVQIASREATWLVEQQGGVGKQKSDDLKDAIGLSWTTNQMEEYDPLSYMAQSRLVRMIMALYRQDTTLANKINNEVVSIKTDFFTKVNAPDTDSDDTTDQLISEYSKSL